MSAEPDTAAVSAVRPSVWPGAGRALLSTTDTAAAPSAGAGHRGRRSPEHAYTPPAAAVGTNHRLRTPPGVRGACGTAATWRCRPDFWMMAAARVSGRLRTWTLQATAVQRCVRKPRPVSERRCPPRTSPPSAGVRCYEKRSPARRRLDGCRHRR
jgi:hypothetical protein